MMQMRLPCFILAMAITGTVASGCAAAIAPADQKTAPVTSGQKVKTMKIRIKIEDRMITATLLDNATSRDFVSLLPLTLTLKDYAETEKISDLPKKLSTAGAPAGSDPSVGDIAYYAPWGNLALYHQDFGYSSGLILLGKIDSGVDVLRQPGPLKATIERINE